MRKIVFATNNRHKLEEVQAMLEGDFQLITPRDCGITEEIPEDHPTLEGNALQKARYIHQRTGLDCFADDTGLEVEALNGAPGVHSARYAGETHDSLANMALLLKNMESLPDRERGARFRTVIALIFNGEEHLFAGEIRGVIIREPAGSHGFGYDPLFRPEGYDITFAEMDGAEKNRISHRARAVACLVAFLKEKPATLNP